MQMSGWSALVAVAAFIVIANATDRGWTPIAIGNANYKAEGARDSSTLARPAGQTTPMVAEARVVKDNSAKRSQTAPSHHQSEKAWCGRTAAGGSNPEHPATTGGRAGFCSSVDPRLVARY